MHVCLCERESDVKMQMHSKNNKYKLNREVGGNYNFKIPIQAN